MDDCSINTILLGYDGSEGAEKAARLAACMARQHDARLVVVVVFHEPDIGGKGEMEGRVNPDVSAAQATAEDMALKLQAAGVDSQADALEGHPGEALLRAAAAHQADLIVVGRRGHGRLAELLLGATSEYVVRRAEVPVLVAH